MTDYGPWTRRRRSPAEYFEDMGTLESRALASLMYKRDWLRTTDEKDVSEMILQPIYMPRYEFVGNWRHAARTFEQLGWLLEENPEDLAELKRIINRLYSLIDKAADVRDRKIKEKRR